MAAVALACTSISFQINAFHSTFLPALRIPACVRRSRSSRTQRPQALFGGKKDEGNTEEKKKFITREQEPEQYWQTAAEKEGKGPMSTVLPYIVILGFLTPFIILGIAFANGWVKVPVR